MGAWIFRWKRRQILLLLLLGRGRVTRSFCVNNMLSWVG